jgi:hypothetical protein
MFFVAQPYCRKEEEILILKQLHVSDCKLVIEQQQDEYYG